MTVQASRDADFVEDVSVGIIEQKSLGLGETVTFAVPSADTMMEYARRLDCISGDTYTKDGVVYDIASSRAVGYSTDRATLTWLGRGQYTDTSAFIVSMNNSSTMTVGDGSGKTLDELDGLIIDMYVHIFFILHLDVTPQGGGETKGLDVRINGSRATFKVNVPEGSSNDDDDDSDSDTRSDDERAEDHAKAEQAAREESYRQNSTVSVG